MYTREHGGGVTTSMSGLMYVCGFTNGGVTLQLCARGNDEAIPRVCCPNLSGWVGRWLGYCLDLSKYSLTGVDAIEELLVAYT